MITLHTWMVRNQGMWKLQQDRELELCPILFSVHCALQPHFHYAWDKAPYTTRHRWFCELCLKVSGPGRRAKVAAVSRAVSLSTAVIGSRRQYLWQHSFFSFVLAVSPLQERKGQGQPASSPVRPLGVMVPADWPHLQYGTSLAAGFWTGTGFAEGSLPGDLSYSNEPWNWFPPINLHPSCRCGCSMDAQADTANPFSWWQHAGR